MKKTILVLVTVCLILSLVACAPQGTTEEQGVDQDVGSSDEKTDEATDEANDGATDEATDETADSNYKIALVASDKTSSWSVRTAEGAVQFGEENASVDVFTTGPAESDAVLQVQVIEDLIAQQYDAICVVPLDYAAVEPVLKKAKDQGIVTITHEGAGIENATFDLEAFNNVSYGEFLMDEFAQQMGEEGKYLVMVGWVTYSTHTTWAEAAIARQQEKYPNMELLPDRIVESQDSPEKAYQIAKELLKKYPDINGVIGVDAYSPPGLARAAEELGIAGELQVTGTGIPAECKEYLEKGYINSVSLWDPAGAGYAMCSLAAMILDGVEIADGADLGWEGYESMKLDGNVIMGDAILTITKDNVDDYIF